MSLGISNMSFVYKSHLHERSLFVVKTNAYLVQSSKTMQRKSTKILMMFYSSPFKCTPKLAALTYSTECF